MFYTGQSVDHYSFVFLFCLCHSLCKVLIIKTVAENVSDILIRSKSLEIKHFTFQKKLCCNIYGFSFPKMSIINVLMFSYLPLSFFLNQNVICAAYYRFTTCLS